MVGTLAKLGPGGVARSLGAWLVQACGPTVTTHAVSGRCGWRLTRPRLQRAAACRSEADGRAMLKHHLRRGGSARATPAWWRQGPTVSMPHPAARAHSIPGNRGRAEMTQGQD